MRGSVTGADSSGTVRLAGGIMADTGRETLSEEIPNGDKASLVAPEAIRNGLCAAATPVASKNRKIVRKRRFMKKGGIYFITDSPAKRKVTMVRPRVLNGNLLRLAGSLFWLDCPLIPRVGAL